MTPRRDDREICTNIGNAVIRNGPDTLSEQVQVDKPPHDLWERLHEAAEIESATRSGEPGLLFAIAKEEADPVVHFVDRRGAVLQTIPAQSFLAREVGRAGARPRAPGADYHFNRCMSLDAAI